MQAFESSFKKNKAVLFVFLVFAVYSLQLIANLLKNYFSCFNGYDFGIYTQAAFHLSKFSDLNPFVTIRGIEIFNDHFDPILFIPTLLIHFVQDAGVVLLVYEWAMPIALILALKWALSLPFRSKQFLVLCCLVFFGRGMLSAVSYPIHASVWSMPFWGLFVASLFQQRLRLMALSVLMICMSKESYPIAFMAVLPLFIIFKKHKEATVVFTIAALSCFMVFVLRPMLLGPVYGHGEQLMANFFANPFLALLQSLKHLDLSNFINLFLPLVALGVLCARSAQLSKEQWKLSALAIAPTLPIFFLQLIAGEFSFQYSFLFYAVVISVAMAVLKESDFAMRSKWITAIVVLFIFTGFRYYEFAIKTVFTQQASSCKMNAERRLDLAAAQAIVKDKSEAPLKVAATGGIVSSLIPYQDELFHLASHGDIQDQYQMLILERNGFGDVYPLNSMQIEQFIQYYRDKFQILYESEGLIVFKGVFGKEMLFGNAK